MRDVPERHRSLRAAFDQSWRLLSGEQQEPWRGSRCFAATLTRGGRRDRGSRPAPALRPRVEIARPTLGLRPLRGARVAAPVRDRAAGCVAWRRGGRPRAACASLRGDARGTAGGPVGPAGGGRARRAARRAGQPARRGRVDPGRRRRARALPGLGASTRSSGAHWFDRARRSSGSLARPASTATPPQARAPFSAAAPGSPSVPDSGSTVAAEDLAARRLPSCGRGSWNESSQAACAPWASWPCIGTSTQKRWRSPRRGRRSLSRFAPPLSETPPLLGRRPDTRP